MIQLDRSLSTPVGEQLAEQLRFHLATGRFRPGEQLPSTRALADQVGVSFHTVRKAYQALEGEGLLEARRGSGYTVVGRGPEPVADRLERGAAVVQEAVQRLIGLGLDEDEIGGLVEEQLAFLDRGARPRVVVAAPYRELAEATAEQVSAAVQERAEAILLGGLPSVPAVDLVVVPHAAYRQAVQALPQAEVVGVLVHPPSGVLAEVARLLPTQTLGLVTRYPDAVQPLLAELRHLTGFGGPALALAADAGRDRLADLAAEVDLLVFTPQAHRRLRPLLADVPHALLTLTVDRGALEAVAAAVRR